MDISKLKVGDRIEVNTYHLREGRKKAIRKIVSIDSLGVGIRMFGYNPFYLKSGEIIRKVERIENGID